MLIFTCMSSINFIVTTHKWSYACFNCSLKLWVVKFVGSFFIHWNWNFFSVMLLIVKCPMFSTCYNSLILHSLNIIISHFTRKKWIFTKRFKISTSSWYSGYVHHGTKLNISSLNNLFLSSVLSKIVHQLSIPTGCNR